MSDDAAAKYSGPPLPPDDISVYRFVKDQWDGIFNLWKKGYAADQQLSALIESIESHRENIFDRKLKGNDYNWEWDWFRANAIHQSNLDFVANRKKHNEDLKQLWLEWHSEVKSHGLQIAIESLRAMVLVNGAAIIAAIAVLSGEIPKPQQAIIWVSKSTILSSSISIIMLAAGHAWTFEITNRMGNKVRGVLVGHPRHSKLYAISRYLRRFMDSKLRWATLLIYGAIAIFGLNALFAAIFLVLSVN